jgi:hypothetical protein
MYSEAFAVSQSDCYPIAKRVQQIVISFIVLVAYAQSIMLSAANDAKAFFIVLPKLFSIRRPSWPD